MGIELVTEDIRRRNGIYFDEATSIDPIRKIAAVEQLVESLIATMEIAGCDEYTDKLKSASVRSRRAHYHYYQEHDLRGALEWANAAMNDVTSICYDRRWVVANPKSYAPAAKQ